MEIKTFGGKKIKIRKITKKDLRNVKKFQDFINSFVKENAKLTINRNLSLKEEKEWLKKNLNEIKKRQKVYLIAECDDQIIGAADINLYQWRSNHVGNFGITIRRGYRGIGLGKYLMKKIIGLAKKELKPKIIILSVFPTNKPAINLYKKMGFKTVARIPKQLLHSGKLIDEVIMLLYL